jgi:hypothetical protein
MDLAVLRLDPGQLVNYLISPLVEALVANVHLRVKDPKEAEPLLGENFHWYVHNFRIWHCVVVKVEFVIAEHEACIVPLSSLDPPGWINLDHLEGTQLVD